MDIEVLRAAVSRGPFLSGLSWENLPLPFWGCHWVPLWWLQGGCVSAAIGIFWVLATLGSVNKMLPHFSI